MGFQKKVNLDKKVVPNKKSLDGNVETFLLLILEESPNYGYAIVRELKQKTDGLLRLGEGTVYPVLYRMEERGVLGIVLAGRAQRPQAEILSRRPEGQEGARLEPVAMGLSRAGHGKLSATTVMYHFVRKGVPYERSVGPVFGSGNGGGRLSRRDRSGGRACGTRRSSP